MYVCICTIIEFTLSSVQCMCSNKNPIRDVMPYTESSTWDQFNFFDFFFFSFFLSLLTSIYATNTKTKINKNKHQQQTKTAQTFLLMVIVNVALLVPPMTTVQLLWIIIHYIHKFYRTIVYNIIKIYPFIVFYGYLLKLKKQKHMLVNRIFSKIVYAGQERFERKIK